MRTALDAVYDASKNYNVPLRIGAYVLAVDKVARALTELERKATPIGSLDTMIAAHALSQQATLITNNSREFARVPGIRIEDWAQS